ncbi:MAG: dihydrodipicolinate reductase [Desulfobacterales bacterium]|nr:dihydrodipicolinate reductase [Deltaproteobacteria bacterium]NIR13482.1 dihydrodipicolinate reductase [Desulfobacterales bacterium]
MNKKIKVVQYGLGPIGCRSVQYLVERDHFDLVGAIDSDEHKVGVDVGELAELPKSLGIHVTDDSTNLLRQVDAEVVVLTTTSSLEQIRPQVLEIISCGKNVVSTCEELMYPWQTNPSLAKEIDVAAREKGVSVLSTGVNPGFLMDFLPLVMTGVCRDVEKVTVERIQDAQFRRLPFQKKIGAGLTVQEFEERVKAGNLRHVGLTESMHLLAAGLGWKLDRTEDIVEPVIASTKVITDNLTIEPDRALGVNQTGRGYNGDKELITLVFRATIGEPEPRDRVLIQGTPSIDMAIEEGVNGDTATCAIIVNAIPVVIQARAGLRTMADISPISFFS